MNRRFNAISLQQASDESPVLANLLTRVRDTNARLLVVREVIPRELHASVVAGPVEDGVWCLLVRSSAAAAKLRQLLPLLQQRLHSQGWSETRIRIKVQQNRY